MRDVCTIADEEKPQYSFDVEFIDIHKLKSLGLLLCEGSNKEKAFEFYDICQDNFQEKIACNDKDFEAAFPVLFEELGLEGEWPAVGAAAKARDFLSLRRLSSCTSSAATVM